MKSHTRKIAALTFMFLFFTAAVTAATVLSVDVTVTRNRTASIDSIQVQDGEIGSYHGSPGNYTFEVLDTDSDTLWNQSRTVNFVIYTQPPSEVTQKTQSFRIPFQQNMQTFNVYFNGERIASRTLQLCNQNNQCDGDETYLSCPNDCATHSADGVCNPAADGGCDPDCQEGIDPDCAAQEPGSNCGNGVCDSQQEYELCPADCRNQSTTVQEPPEETEPEDSGGFSFLQMLLYLVAVGVVGVIVYVLVQGSDSDSQQRRGNRPPRPRRR